MELSCFQASFRFKLEIQNRFSWRPRNRSLDLHGAELQIQDRFCAYLVSNKIKLSLEFEKNLYGSKKVDSNFVS